MRSSLENLTVSAQKLETALHAFSDLTNVLDRNGVILDDKLGPFAQYGFLEIARHRKMQDIFSDDLKEKFERALHTVQQTGDVNTLQYSLPISNRVRWFDARLVPVSKSQVMFVARDITECREIENRSIRQMQQFSALRTIDLAIASGLDLNLLLSMLLDQVTALLRIDAVSI